MPSNDGYLLSPLQAVQGGGAAVPVAIAQKLADRGIPYCEGYGLSETIAPTHINPKTNAILRSIHQAK